MIKPKPRTRPVPKPDSGVATSRPAKPVKASTAAKKPAVKAERQKAVVAKTSPKTKVVIDRSMVGKAVVLAVESSADETLAVIDMAPAVPKHKLVRDSFTMPRADFDLVDVLKARALVFQRPTRKSELLRAGLHALSALSDAQLRKSLDALTPLKAGRPKAG